MGLLRDDILDEDKIVTEALRRLDPDVLAERNFRIIRAGYLCMRKDVLPEEEWTKLENDVLYLQPFIKQVEEELAEKEQWERE
ncbi:PREDICTED: cytochrome b-c1 complex subunit 7-like [Ceratosolen solmsi marchali]|uniref:Cytochrome b-c1 complex subunit 7 n=2 Tax=Ceratosolen solmsi TaxID=142686 RepID=A0AAJ6YWJ3_9HYME|nr:PREDICTED: cytochrome b-c1 complex subunit 7-like [Ceratosolen solmsi marchali]